MKELRWPGACNRVSPYFDGKKTTDEILHRTEISRKQLREVLHHFDEYVSAVFATQLDVFSQHISVSEVDAYASSLMDPLRVMIDFHYYDRRLYDDTLRDHHGGRNRNVHRRSLRKDSIRFWVAASGTMLHFSPEIEQTFRLKYTTDHRLYMRYWEYVTWLEAETGVRLMNV